MKDAVRSAEETARILGIDPALVLVASTGVIGHRLPVDRLIAGARAAAAQEGLLVGISSGAALWAAMELATSPAFAPPIPSHTTQRSVFLSSFSIRNAS